VLGDFAEHHAISVVLATVCTWLAIWGLIDALRQSGLAFLAAGHSKAL
jgi:hypothetical protein